MATSYDWYLIFNKTEFEALSLVSKVYTVNLESVGEKEVFVTKGVGIGILYEEVFLPLDLLDYNPFEFEGFAIFINDDTQDVYLGIAR